MSPEYAATEDASVTPVGFHACVRICEGCRLHLAAVQRLRDADGDVPLSHPMEAEFSECL